jgi:hypothetical protein
LEKNNAEEQKKNEQVPSMLRHLSISVPVKDYLHFFKLLLMRALLRVYEFVLKDRERRLRRAEKGIE